MTTFFLMSVDALWSGKVFVGAVAGYAYAYGGFGERLRRRAACTTTTPCVFRVSHVGVEGTKTLR